MAKLNVKNVRNSLENGKNVFVIGAHGTGKTAIGLEAVKQTGEPYAYLSCSTIDPYLTIVGTPVPYDDPENPGKKKIDLVRPLNLDNVKYLILDEFTRSIPATMNALMEAIQFKSINGQKLPNLKAIYAASNPANGEYYTTEVDKAIMDRFDFFYQVEPECDVKYFRSKHGYHVGATAVKLWREYENARLEASEKNKVEYVSPRRMDTLVANFLWEPTVDTVRASMPLEVEFSAEAWHQALMEARDEDKAASVPTDVEGAVTFVKDAPVAEIISWSPEFVRDFLGNFENSDRVKVAEGLLSRMGESEFSVPVITESFEPVFEHVSADTVSAVFDPFELGSPLSGKFWALMDSPRIRSLAG